MKYWKQFAEMLGLELDEEFSLTDADGKKIDDSSYKILAYGIYKESKDSINGSWFYEHAETLEYLLNGDFKAVPKPWKPKDGEAYWKWDTYVEMAQFKRWNGSSTDFACWKLGNCFKTSEEAQSKGKEIMEQIKKEFDEA